MMSDRKWLNFTVTLTGSISFLNWVLGFRWPFLSLRGLCGLCGLGVSPSLRLFRALRNGTPEFSQATVAKVAKEGFSADLNRGP
jgi:hypothetical protein